MYLYQVLICEHKSLSVVSRYCTTVSWYVLKIEFTPYILQFYIVIVHGGTYIRVIFESTIYHYHELFLKSLVD